MSLRESLRLYAITDSTWLNGRKLEDVVKEAIIGGVTMIQYRAKNIDYDKAKKEAISICQICHKYNIPFIINDNVNLAKEIKADGVHLGASDMDISEARKILGADAIIGATAKTVEQAKLAYEKSADYLGSGAVFGSTTKTDAVYMTMDRLLEITESVDIPVVAIGGINIDNIDKLVNTKIAGVAVVSGIFKADNITEISRKFRIKLDEILDSKYHSMRCALTIAGSDCSGGAGIQADLKTMQANGIYGMSVITALTAQNTMAVDGISEVSPEFVGAQLDSVFNDIVPDAVKIGMLSSAKIIEVIADKLKKYRAKNIVLDPVMVSTSGCKLIKDDAMEALTKKLIPMATVVTPNIPEAEILADMKIETADDIKKAADIIYKKYNCGVLLKGGHSINTANDLLVNKNGVFSFNSKRIDNENTHGTGCTLSSAIASNLAKGYDLEKSVKNAKEYLSKALEDMLDLGHGSGPLNHGFNL